jgi:hypothetical protein
MQGTQAGKTGLEFTGNRQPVHPMPIPLRQMIRKWCHLNGVFMSQDGDYITLIDSNEFEHKKKSKRNVMLVNGVKTIMNESNTGKEKVIKLFLNYHKSQDGKECVIASNARTQIKLNITGMMAIEHQIQNLSFPEEVMKMFNANILGDE